ncbi:Di-copper centre-containing protein [Lentinula aciculospora]|uniref:tyrosinase n=1 Tax=Lentinula aciculospora TaxID=153920 RepID=A0A9W9DSJ3_9AGAR|nr:Di-copper centre-containing protein [Lentinula aciculospora]
MSSTPYFIHGIPGGVYTRLEVRELAQSNEQWTLFNLSLQRIQQADYTPVAAKFLSLGGIHGLPYQGWSGDPKGAPGPISKDYGGYCNHASILFPTWHRPYLLALEQSIGEAAMAIAGELTEGLPDNVKQVWLTAAQQLRWPFWDWTDPRTRTEGLPSLLRPYAVTLKLPNGTQKVLAQNPLATYNFENPRPAGFQNMENSGDDEWSPFQVGQTGYFKDWTSTYRWPTNTADPKEQYANIDDLLTDKDDDRYGWKALRSNAAHLFTFPIAAGNDESPFIWDEFSNTTFQSKATKIARGMKDYKAGSLEHPHNSIHLLLGGLGHMSNNDYAGFDPIFYMHHANVDRIFALWEYVYPDYWMGEGYYDKNGTLIKFVQPDGTWSEAPNAAIDEVSVLEPFRNDSNIYWTSKDTHGLRSDENVQKWYTYVLTHNQVTIDVSKPSSEADRAKYLALLQDYFGLNIEVTRRRFGIGNHPIIPVLRGSGEPPSRFKEVDDYRHFIIVADILEHAYSGSYRLELLFNNINIGMVTSLARGLDTLCAGCQGRRQIKNRIQGTIAIDQYVVNQIYSLVEGSDRPNQEDVFKEVLKLAFSARLVGPTGTVLATASIDVDPTEGNALPQDKCPNITIYSSSAATHEEHEYCLFFDDKEYGNILERKWVAIPPAQRG